MKNNECNSFRSFQEIRSGVKSQLSGNWCSQLTTLSPPHLTTHICYSSATGGSKFTESTIFH